MKAISRANCVLAVAAGCLAGFTALSLLRRPQRFSVFGKTVVVTGGSRGLGFAIAKRFASNGARLALIARTPDELIRAVADIEAFGGTAIGVVADIRDAQQVNAAIADIASRLGRIDVLVNNAGIIQVTPLANARPEDFADSLATHFWGPYYLTSAALPFMRAAGGGRIVNIASIGGRVSVPHMTPYSVGKAALVMFSEGLRSELASEGIYVTTAAPGLMRTGGHVHAEFRGRQQSEAAWFQFAATSRYLAISAEQAANEIVDACLEGRATVSPNLQSRLGDLAHALTPELTASVLEAVTELLPRPRATLAQIAAGAA